MTRRARPGGRAEPYHPLFPYLPTAERAVLAPGEIVIDNFAGLGGASSAIEAALGRPVDVAINHNPIALELHRQNHPYTHHYIEDVWSVDPERVCAGRKIALAWFSPDCRHFSKAKGGQPVSASVRGLANVVHNYSGLPEHLKPRVIMLENVEEFTTWGPLIEVAPGKFKPDPARAGEDFQAWKATLEAHGYTVEHRELRACDYGAPTIRKRLFLIARSDGQPIVWPEPTHGDPKSKAVKEGRLLPWRTAAECIDWTLPTPSIFTRKKALVPATMRRVAIGIKKFVLATQDPYIVTCNHAGDGFRGQGLHEPMRTLTAARDAHGLVAPVVVRTDQHQSNASCAYDAARPLTTITTAQGHAIAAPYLINKQFQAPARPAEAPLSTITTNHNKNELGAAFLVRSGHYSNITGEGAHFRGQGMEQPLSTVTAAGQDKLITVAHLTKFRTGSVGSPADAPLHTVTGGGEAARPSTGNVHGLVAASLLQHNSEKHGEPGSMNYAVDRPLRTVMAQGGRQDLLTGYLTSYYGEKRAGETRGRALTGQVPTVRTENCLALTAGTLIGVGGRAAQTRPKGLNEPIHTVTSKADTSLALASLVQYNGTADAQPAGAPLGSVTTVERFGLSVATLTRHFGNSTAVSIAEPVGTICADGGGKTYLVNGRCEPILTPEQRASARRVYAFLVEYLGSEALGAHADHAAQLITVTVRGELYVLADIGMRMLTPRELARCQGFSDHYVLDATLDGKPIAKSHQVKGIGNSVSKPPAAAILTANFSGQMSEAAD